VVLVGGLAGLAGALGPWIPHRAAGLRIGGFDLFEMSKFFPAVRSGALPLIREAFVLPSLLSALALCLAPAVDRRLPRLFRWLCPAIAVGIALAALPPYPAILAAHQDPMYRGRLLLAAGTLLLALLSPMARQLPPRSVGGILIALAAGGLWLPISQFVRVRSLFAALYGAPVGIGWGLIAYGAGMGLLLLVGAARLFAAAPGRSPH